MASISAVMEDVAAWKTLTHADASARGEAAVWRLGEEPRCVGSSSRRRREAEVMCRRYFSCGGGGWGSSTRRHEQVDCGVDGRGGGVIATAFGAAVMVESWWIHCVRLLSWFFTSQCYLLQNQIIFCAKDQALL